jgi:hypothetical protein
MGYFSRPDTVVVLNPDDEPSMRNTVMLRQWTTAERNRILSMGHVNGDGLSPDTDLLALTMEAVNSSVVAWSGPDFEGRPATPENIAQLPPDVFDIIAKACQRMITGLTDDEKKTSDALTSSKS